MVLSMETLLSIPPAPIASENLASFALAGNAIFTVRSEKTQNRFTFKIEKSDGNGPASHFVSVLTGPQNTTDYTFVGSVFDGQRYFHGKRSRISPNAASAVAAKWVCEKVLAGTEMKGVEVWHEGRCGRCARPLTTPESIQLGIGPECAKKMGL
jgi:hypothetical protein